MLLAIAKTYGQMEIAQRPTDRLAPTDLSTKRFIMLLLTCK